MSSENNRFALFELCGRKVKVIDDRTILADVLGKFERYIIIIPVSVCRCKCFMCAIYMCYILYNKCVAL